VVARSLDRHEGRNLLSCPIIIRQRKRPRFLFRHLRSRGVSFKAAHGAPQQFRDGILLVSEAERPFETSARALLQQACGLDDTIVFKLAGVTSDAHCRSIV
jgi:hypothetical protein